MILFTIDPGIDVTGVAVWDIERVRWNHGHEGAARALLEIHSLRSKAGESVARCAAIAWQFTQLVQRWQGFSRRTYIELPPLWHDRRQKGQRTPGKLFDSLFKLNRAIGALAVASHAAGVLPKEVEASRAGKEYRLAYAEQFARAAGVAVPTNEDERSAVWIGLDLIATMQRDIETLPKD